MDFPQEVAVILLCLSGLVPLLLRWLQRRGWVNVSRDRVRRGTGHAMLGLQEFIEPSVEYVVQAENIEQKAEDDLDAVGDDLEAIARDLETSLGLSTIAPEEVRRALAAAVRAGLNWQDVYEEAVRAELKDRPFRAPSIPPAWKVAPAGAETR